MTHLSARSSIEGGDIMDCAARDPDEFARILAPVMAGARARGVADAFELMGVAAILIDGHGRVLHAGGRAERALRPLGRISNGHLIGADAALNRVIQTVIAACLRGDSDSGDGQPTVLSDAEGCARLSLKVHPVRQERDQAVQLLRAVVVVHEFERDATSTGVGQL